MQSNFERDDGTDERQIAMGEASFALRKVLQSRCPRYETAEEKAGLPPGSIRQFLDAASKDPVALVNFHGLNLIAKIEVAVGVPFLEWLNPKLVENEAYSTAEVCSRIDELLALTGFTVNTLSGAAADKTKYKNKMLSVFMWENRYHPVSSRQMFNRALAMGVAEATGVSRDWLICGDGPMVPPGGTLLGPGGVRVAWETVAVQRPARTTARVQSAPTDGAGEIVLQGEGGEARIRDLDLARVLGFKDPGDIREIIRRHIKAGNFNPFTVHRTARETGGRPGTEYWLTEEEALFVTTHSETPKAVAMTKEVIRVFTLARRGKLPGQPTGMDATAVQNLVATTVAETVKALVPDLVKATVGPLLAEHRAALVTIMGRVDALEERTAPPTPEPTVSPPAPEQPTLPISDPVRPFYGNPTHDLSEHCPARWRPAVEVVPRVVRAMTEAGISGSDLGRKMNPAVSSQYWRTRRGEANRGRFLCFRLDTVARLAEALGCSFEYLAWGTEPCWTSDNPASTSTVGSPPQPLQNGSGLLV